MKLTVQLKLQPTPDQADALRHTLETANAACDSISQVAWETQTFRQFAIHKLTYQAVRDQFGLAAQLTVRCIAKVADAYKLDRKMQRSFVPHGAIAYDARILSFARPDKHGFDLDVGWTPGDPRRVWRTPTPIAHTSARRK